MDTLFCDVIGCCCPARWVHTRNANNCQDKNLCNACWAKLRLCKPHEALCYITIDAAVFPDFPIPNTLTIEWDNEEVINIGA